MMQGTIDDLARRLTADPEFREAQALVEELGREGRASDLVDLWRAVGERGTRGQAPISVCETACDLVVEQLALAPGPGRVEALLDLLVGEGAARLYRHRPREVVLRGFASRLGYAQSRDALLATLERGTGDADRTELLACWMHEVVLTGVVLEREPSARALQERLAAMHHPLAPFPLRLLDAEREAPTYMPMYGADAIQKAVQTLESGPTSIRTVPPPGERTMPHAAPLGDARLEARLGEAVSVFSESGKGRVEARAFTLAPPAEGEVGRSFLRALPLDSTQGEKLEVMRVAADTAWGALFAAAANGGAYSTGLGGAYGRRAAWVSFTALVGLPEGAPVEACDRAATSVRFLTYAGTEFFFDVAWDLGVVAIRAGGTSVAILAATDTD